MPVLPRTDADYGGGGDFYAFLGADVHYVVHPGVRVLDLEDAPGEGASDDPIEAAAYGDAGTVLCSLELISAAHGIVRESAATVVPFVEEVLFQSEVVNFVGNFAPAEHEFAEGRKAVRGERRKAEAAAVEERVRAHFILRLVHDQAAADFGDNLPLGIDACGAGTPATDAGTAAEKRFVIGESGEFDVRGFGARLGEFDARRFPGVFDVDERLLPDAVLVVFKKHFANFVICAEEIQTGIANPGRAESHHVGKGAAGIQETAHENNDGAIVCAILQTHDEVTVRGIFGKHGDEAESGSVDKSNEARRSVKHDVADGGFAGRADFPLGVPNRGEGHGA